MSSFILQTSCVRLLVFPIGFAKFVRAANDFIGPAQQFALLINEQFGVAHDIDEQDMPDLQTGLFFGRHLLSLPSCHAARLHHPFGASEATICSKRGSPRSGSQTGNRFKAP
jgi:hypothetical protein